MDPKEIKIIHEKYGFLIYNRCLNLLGSEDEAMDAFQDIFMKLIKYKGTVKDNEVIIPWIYRVVKNHCLNVIRYRKKFADNEVLEYMPTGGDFDDKISNKMLINQILSIHNQKVQDAVYYTYIEKLNQEEIRTITGQSPATIRRNLNKFKESLPGIKKRLELN